MAIPLVFVALHLEKPDIKYTKNLAKKGRKIFKPNSSMDHGTIKTQSLKSVIYKYQIRHYIKYNAPNIYISIFDTEESFSRYLKLGGAWWIALLVLLLYGFFFSSAADLDRSTMLLLLSFIFWLICAWWGRTDFIKISKSAKKVTETSFAFFVTLSFFLFW